MVETLPALANYPNHPNHPNSPHRILCDFYHTNDLYSLPIDNNPNDPNDPNGPNDPNDPNGPNDPNDPNNSNDSNNPNKPKTVGALSGQVLICLSALTGFDKETYTHKEGERDR